MNAYVSMIEKLGADHLTEKERLLIAEKWGQKISAPKPMTEDQIRRAALREQLEKRKK